MKVLIAEDDAVTNALLTNTLKNWGFEVISAGNGLEALNVLKQPNSPKLLIVDWMMPGLNGIELCQTVRQQKGEAYRYIILLSGKADKKNVIEGLEAGADDYITKPCNPDELKVRLNAGLRIIHLEEELLSTMSQLKESFFATGKQTQYETALTAREMEILRLVAQGKKDEEIAKVFHLSLNWVNAHINNICDKLNVRNRAEAAAKAVQDGLHQRPKSSIS